MESPSPLFLGNDVRQACVNIPCSLECPSISCRTLMRAGVRGCATGWLGCPESMPCHVSFRFCAASRFKANNHIPGFVNREYVEQSPTPGELAAISTKGTVSGENRFKYHKRPLLGSASAVPQSMTVGTLSPAPVGEGQRSRTVATQSVYRESEAQTLPYSPDYVLPDQTSDKQRALMDKYHTDIPEVLTLQKMKFGQGLPIGLAELNRIDKLREKRAFEAQLPPLHDLEQLPRRKAMMEAWEHKEWAEREEEIRRLQEERLELLARAIEQREENIEAIAVERVETIKAREFAKRDQVVPAGVQGFRGALKSARRPF